MYKVINETHIQKMPDAENFTTRGPHDQLDFDGASYEDAYKNLPEPILRGDSGQWKQGQVLQDDEVRVVFDWDLDTSNSYYKRGTTGPNKVAIPAKPKPIETLFKEAMEDYVHNRYPIDETYTATGEEKQYLKRQAAFNTGWWAFNYLLTNKMIK